MGSVLTPGISIGSELNWDSQLVLENWRMGVEKIHTFDVKSYVIKDTTAGNEGHEVRK